MKSCKGFLPRKIDSALDENGFDVYFKLFTLLYADDVLAQSESELQLAFDALSEYCKKKKKKKNGLNCMKMKAE